MSVRKKISFLGRSLAFLSAICILGGAIAYYKGYGIDDLETLAKEYAPFFFETSDTLIADSSTVVVKHEPKPKPKLEAKPENLELLPEPINPFSLIDIHARKCPTSSTESIESLAAYLEIPCSNDLEKARAIYVWLAKFISYDDEGYNSSTYDESDNSALGVLKSRKSVCEGFSNLYQALGRAMNLKIRKVSGYSKGYGYEIGQKLAEPNHAWNLIKIEDEWRVFDATWGEGFGSNVSGNLKSSKEFDEYWFNVDPYEAIFSHFPENPGLAYVKPVINLQTFESLPAVDEGYFRMGFRGTYVYNKALTNKNAQFPKSYKYNFHVKVKRAPPLKGVKKGKASAFRFFIPKAYAVALIDSKENWIYLKRIDGVFQAEYTPKHTGPLKVSVRTNSGRSYSTILEYEVRN